MTLYMNCDRRIRHLEVPRAGSASLQAMLFEDGWESVDIYQPHDARFAVVRNPFDRLVSVWQSQQLGDWRQFVLSIPSRLGDDRNCPFRPQVDFLPAPEKACDVYRLEDNAIGRIAQRFGLGREQKLNRSARGAADGFFDGCLTEIVREVYSDDFERFGYSANPWELTARVHQSEPVCDVVIPCHNYARYLRECVESVRASSVPANIIVVDDSSTDDTREVCQALKVRYVRIEAGSVLRARQTGFDLGTLPYVLFLDADDILSPDYIRTGVEILKPNAAAGIAYSDLECFGDSHEVKRLKYYNRGRLAVTNSIHAGSIYRRAALTISRAMEQETADSTHDDWAVARRVVRDGWQVAKNPSNYLYRQHGASMMDCRVSRNYYLEANLSREPVTLMVPISGRADAMQPMFDFLTRQTRDKSTIKLILGDGSGSQAVAKEIRNWLAQCDYPDARYLKLDCGPEHRSGLADVDRRGDRRALSDVRLIMARIYCQLRAEVTTDYVWILEDDVIPPDDCCDRLLTSMQADVAAVSAPYLSRYWDHYASRKTMKDPHRQRGTGVEKIALSGFGCIVMRTSILKAGPITNVCKTEDYDFNFFYWLSRRGGKLLLDWSCEAEHIGAILRTDKDSPRECSPLAVAQAQT